ncbi:hypothetical protein Daci_4705 [Delftia acidovorans SPH-1]|uniref:Uncharacterized protein n=2 Tax=Comamonadaceae TaxID=80864 RepID=A9C3M3_DELAS|nr:hypothetical protein Daci_4705 [Delftia acidovorans SPH-1]
MMMSFFVIWILISGMGDDFISWIGGKGNLSGWVQAVAVIVSLAISIYLPYREKIIKRNANYELVLACMHQLRDVLHILVLEVPRTNRIDSAFSVHKEEISVVRGLLSRVNPEDLPTSIIRIWHNVLVIAEKLERHGSSVRSRAELQEFMRIEISRLNGYINDIK